MANHTIADYNHLIDDRPEKWLPDSVHYRPSDGEEKCRRCLHFYTRKLDGFGVCELIRDADTDEDGVDGDNVCDFYTQDGENFPLLEDTE
jgi:hypothetical protein